jgi:phosphate transport system permease protein
MKQKLLQSQYNQRALKDRLAKYFVSLGGVSVIIAIMLIFFYLLSVVVPMFESADIEQQHQYAAPGDGKTLLLGMEEQGTMAVRFTDQGEAIFFNTATSEISLQQKLPLNSAISSVASSLDRIVLGLEDGTALIVKYVFEVSYPGDVRTLTPALEFPLGEQALVLDESAQPIEKITFQISSDSVGLAGVTADKRLLFARYSKETSFISEEVTIELETRVEQQFSTAISDIALKPDLENLYAASADGILLHYRIDRQGIELAPTEIPFDQPITQLQLLLGGNSLLVGLQNGEVQQWMLVRVEDGDELTYIRNFHEALVSVENIETEQRRKGFAVADRQGGITLYYSTSQRTLAHINTATARISEMAWSARAEHLLAVDENDQLYFYHVDNEFPEVSWDVLWGKVWYEGYDEPDYIWQSSASTNEFEPKYSLVPLSFGTLKAAFYAMLFAVPVAILGAMFTAQFMAPKMRQTVKPSIEIMEALPTVILGFLAGLWLAPYVEAHLAGVFALLLLLPVAFILFAALWMLVPNKSVFEGWEAALLIPVVLLLIWLATNISVPLEHLFFDGDMRKYMSNEWGLTYDQRNSLVVGLIMGFAVIPTIFSIAEDALFSVPQHLIRGSLALGASRWQTMLRVVIPAASPALFSAIMMGFGRAVGETMIVLMATGNTPLMDMSIFQGMRTLAANIAVEVPEAEVASTHYRILFLAALILFLFTFIFNTLAEVIRHRLRKRYSGL